MQFYLYEFILKIMEQVYKSVFITLLINKNETYERNKMSDSRELFK